MDNTNTPFMDAPYYDDDCRKWITLEESIIESAKGHQISFIQTPKPVDFERRHHQDNPPDRKEAA